MKKRDIDLTQKVFLDGQFFTVVSIDKAIVIEDDKGNRHYSNAGCLTYPSVTLNITLPIKIVADEFDYHVSCPQLKGFHTNGKNIAECLRNGKKAGEGFIASIIKHYNEEHH